jgi:hypothetical protein
VTVCLRQTVILNAVKDLLRIAKSQNPQSAGVTSTVAIGFLSLSK